MSAKKLVRWFTTPWRRLKWWMVRRMLTHDTAEDAQEHLRVIKERQEKIARENIERRARVEALRTQFAVYRREA